MKFYFGCQNCNDAIQHAVYNNTNPFTDKFYHFCNHCNNEFAVRRYNEMRILIGINKILQKSE